MFVLFVWCSRFGGRSWSWQLPVGLQYRLCSITQAQNQLTLLDWVFCRSFLIFAMSSSLRFGFGLWIAASIAAVSNDNNSKMMAMAFSSPRGILSSQRTGGAAIRLLSTTESTSEATGPIVNEEVYTNVAMEDIVSLCKRRGFIFPSSEIYNGMAGFYDYGPLGSELKKNIKDSWWKHFVTRREDVVGLDSSIIHNPTTWQSSGTVLTSIILFFDWTVPTLFSSSYLTKFRTILTLFYLK